MDLFVIEGSYYDDKWLYGVCSSYEAAEKAVDTVRGGNLNVYITRVSIDELRSPSGYSTYKDKEKRIVSSFGFESEAIIDKIDPIQWDNFKISHWIGDPLEEVAIGSEVDVYYDYYEKAYFDIYLLSDKAKETYRKWVLFFGEYDSCSSNLISVDKITSFINFFSAFDCVLKKHTEADSDPP